MPASNSFTTSYKGMSNSLKNKVKVCNPFHRNKSREYLAIWDTGASCSAISEAIANELELIPTGMTKVGTASGIQIVNTYVVDMILPGNISVKKLQVTGAKLNGCDLLVGMDVMGMGGFAISNYKGQTTFSFRIPSLINTDYVKENIDLRATVKKGEVSIGRNSRCPCGSGKKYKQCCGKI